MRSISGRPWIGYSAWTNRGTPARSTAPRWRHAASWRSPASQRVDWLNRLEASRDTEDDVNAPTEPNDGASTDDVVLSVLQYDPAWGWLQAADEDVYSEFDVRSDPPA